MRVRPTNLAGIVTQCLLLLTAACCVLPMRAEQGPVVEKPQSLSGVWETSDGRGGAVGIAIAFTTEVPGRAKTLRGVAQHRQDTWLGVFHRHDPLRRVGDTSWINGAGLVWMDRVLRVKSGERKDPITVELHFDEARSVWAGHLQRGDFDRDVTLTRPVASPGAPKSPLVGHWRENISSGIRCFHISQQGDGGLAGWADEVIVPGRRQFAPGVTPPAATLEYYGNLGMVSLVSSNKLSFVRNGYSALCCYVTFTGTLLSSGNEIRGGWSTPIDGAGNWRRSTDSTCSH